ncbi:MAG: hypothetical protein ACREIS_09870 [Nitrospiraceae bacterium]
MTKRAAALLLASGSFALWPSDAYAQKVPWIVLPLAVSPVLALSLSVALGVVTRSWLVGLGSTGLVIVWVAWFAAASKYSTSDFMVWAPIVALGLHSIGMVWLIGLHVFRRARSRDEA